MTSSRCVYEPHLGEHSDSAKFHAALKSIREEKDCICEHSSGSLYIEYAHAANYAHLYGGLLIEEAKSSIQRCAEGLLAGEQELEKLTKLMKEVESLAPPDEAKPKHDEPEGKHLLDVFRKKGKEKK